MWRSLGQDNKKTVHILWGRPGLVYMMTTPRPLYIRIFSCGAHMYPVTAKLEEVLLVIPHTLNRGIN